MRCLQAALDIAARGGHVLPIWWIKDGRCACVSPDSSAICDAKIPSPGKHPIAQLVPNGQNNSTNDETVIRGWFERYPDCNIALDLYRSGLMAFDIDHYHGDDEKLEALSTSLGELPETIIQYSGSRQGFHGIYRRPEHGLIGKLNDITIRGKNYIVIAPSNHISGHLYEWMPGRSPGEIDVATLPSSWSEALRPVAAVGEVGLPEEGEEPNWLKKITQGERVARMKKHLASEPGEIKGVTPQGTAFNVARTCARGYAVRDPEVVLSAMLEWNQTCQPPYADSAIAQRIYNAYAKAHTPEWGERVRPGLFSDRITTASNDEILASLRAARTKLKRSTDKTKHLQGELISKALNGTFPEEGLVNHLIAAVVWNSPENASVESLAGILAPSLLNVPMDSLLADIREAQEDRPSEIEDVPGEFSIDPKTSKPFVSQHNLDVALEKLSVRLSYDEFADDELLTRGKTEVIQDHHLISLMLEIDREFDFRPMKEFFWDFVTDRARANSFHPVREYLDSLVWDGRSRLDDWLITYAGAKNTEYVRAISRLVMVAAVRRIRAPGCKFDEMVVFEGPQGIAEKSSAIRILAIRDSWYTDDLPLHVDTKAQIERTGGKWIVEAGELKGMTKTDYHTLKSFLSRTTDEARMSYGRKTRIAPRQFIIIGTTNDDQYLNDPTGNRRWWPVQTPKFRLDELRRDVDQLWAEASAAESAGESIRLAPELWPVAAKEQHARRTIDTFEEILREKLGEMTGRIATADVWALLGIDPAKATQQEQTRLGNVMRALKWKRCQAKRDGKQFYCYRRGEDNWIVVAGGRVTA